MRRPGWVLLVVLLLVSAACARQEHGQAANALDGLRAGSNTLTAAGQPADIKIYEGAGHGSMSQPSAPTADASGRIDRFFAANLRGNMPNP
jgi:alpha-beta hydrolase superfamily lysophospholipase